MSSAIYRSGLRNYFHDLKSTPSSIKCKNGNEIIFRGCYNDKEREKLKSITVAQGKLRDVWIEEATELTKEDFNIIDDRLRGILPDGLFYQIKLTFNPISVTRWIKRAFFDTESNDIFAHNFN